jgi:protein-S-isoprenylcysteine O-methyltransferase Ste14
VEKIRQFRQTTVLGEIVYRQRAVMGNAIAFLGFIIIYLDPHASVTMMRLLVGAFIGMVGFALRIWASSYQWHNIAAPLPDARVGLITAGPYAYMRHPIYLSMILLTGGAFIIFGSWLAAILVVILTLVLSLWQARYEECFLVEQYGAQALGYHKHLPRLFPKLWDPYPIRNGTFSVVQGLKYDVGPLSAFLCFIAVMAIITFYQVPTLQVTLVVLVSSVILSFFLTSIVRHAFRQDFTR